MPELTLHCPAKLNLMLHITGRRADGYHLLQSAFQFIDLCDELHFRTTDDRAVRRLSEHADVAPEQDLVVRAAKLLQQRFDVEQGVDISLEKHIPMGGGLGGGSSDAAATLMALNRLWDLDLSMTELQAIGLELGADVPVFVYGHAAWAEGVGEQLQAIDLPTDWKLVIHPNVFVSTAEIFNAGELTRDCQPITIRAFLQGAGENVCEPVARKLYPEVDRAIKWLNQYGEVRMTGTGACVFASFNSRQAAETVKSCLPPEWNGFVVRAMNRNPITERLLISA